MPLRHGRLDDPELHFGRADRANARARGQRPRSARGGARTLGAVLVLERHVRLRRVCVPMATAVATQDRGELLEGQLLRLARQVCVAAGLVFRHRSPASASAVPRRVKGRSTRPRTPSPRLLVRKRTMRERSGKRNVISSGTWVNGMEARPPAHDLTPRLQRKRS
jgi:hypothetical protein